MLSLDSNEEILIPFWILYHWILDTALELKIGQ